MIYLVLERTRMWVDQSTVGRNIDNKQSASATAWEDARKSPR